MLLSDLLDIPLRHKNMRCSFLIEGHFQAQYVLMLPQVADIFMNFVDPITLDKEGYKASSFVLIRS